MNHKSLILQSSFEFALDVVKTYKELTHGHQEYILSRQFLKSGTAVGALVREAQNAESKKDFVHKLSIAQKECDETLYWLELLYAADYIVRENYESLSNKITSVLKMIRSAIITTKKKYLIK